MEARSIRRSLVTIAVGLAMGSAGVAHATNGYFAHGYGTKAKGMGGVGMAISQDAYAPAINPAGIAGMETRIDGSLAYFRPERSLTIDSGKGTMSVDSDSNNFFIPSFGYVQQIDATRSWGIALMGNGGLNTDYPAIENPGCPAPPQSAGNGVFCGGAAGVNLEQLAIIPTYAQQFADGQVSVGVSPIISYQRFKAKGIGAFAFDEQGNPTSVSPQHVSDNGTDATWGYGAQIGFKAEVADGVTVGGSYRSKIRNSDFDDYRGLFAGGGSFDIPSTVGLGVSAEVTPSVTVSADYFRINYSDVDAISNPSTNQAPLGSDNGPGFGWRDINVFKLGAQFETDTDWTWRVGYNRGQNPIRSRDVAFNVLAPGVIEHHFTAGFTKSFGSQHELNFAAMYAPSNSVTGPFDDQGTTAKIEMKQYELEVGYAYRF
ncbi:OmpP1/FadL family transporter [Thioalkalivibrio sp. ALJT]|uniref:OmpP1/FadL family transporter n=1 Tax=Thioalkalivibrio sp. ALJT TaxID=1158146 RepID=UPI00036ACA01|nr:outer membrane protein transport protein [Thioalkalivibrio sp. ALJT]